MPIPTPTDDELRMVHAALHIAVPLNQVSPVVLATLAMIAHCWRGRVPAHLWGRPAATPSPASFKGDLSDRCTNDFKRRAAGDFE